MSKGINDIEILRIRANGKLLISGEYLVMAGARALAVPLKFGQELVVKKNGMDQIRWVSADINGTWFTACIDPDSLNPASEEVKHPGKPGTGERLCRLLKEARLLNPGFLSGKTGYDVKVTADFPLEWGIGSSSTLISLIAGWSGTDPYLLQSKTFGGSGYDIACATATGPLIFSRIGEGYPPMVEKAFPGNALKECAWFAWQGKKQDTASSVAEFRQKSEFSLADVEKLSCFADAFCKAEDEAELNRLVEAHQDLMTGILPPSIGMNACPPSIPYPVKPLGAWGGDFILCISRLPGQEIRSKFREHGIDTVFSWKEIVLDHSGILLPDLHAATSNGNETAPALRSSGNINLRPENSGSKVQAYTASWQSPSNIALIKYWGKKGPQLPANPSLSMSLTQSHTRTTVTAIEGRHGNSVLSVNGDPGHPYIPKLEKVCREAGSRYPRLTRHSFEVTTENSFPASAGIASSASGISAFTLCILDLALSMEDKSLSQYDFLRMASFLSRTGSGSASRSVYGGFAVWGSSSLTAGSSDEFAVPLEMKLHKDFEGLRDCILIVSDKPKDVSSSLGHSLMNDHPWASARYGQAISNLSGCLEAMKTGDFERFAGICETEALSLHSLIMTSAGNPILIKPETLHIIKLVTEALKKGIPLCFTLDAGPNVHLLYPERSADEVWDFISSELLIYCQEGKYIADLCGDGPIPLTNP